LIATTMKKRQWQQDNSKAAVCGKYGHKSVNCQSKGKQENGSLTYRTLKFKGNCCYCCKKAGHKEAGCWKKKKKEVENRQTRQ
jgi:hypothetical protein